MLKACSSLAKNLASRLNLQPKAELQFEVREVIIDSFYLNTLIINDTYIQVLGSKKIMLETSDLHPLMICSHITVGKSNQLNLIGTPVQLEEIKECVPHYYIKQRFVIYICNL